MIKLFIVYLQHIKLNNSIKTWKKIKKKKDF